MMIVRYLVVIAAVVLSWSGAMAAPATAPVADRPENLVRLLMFLASGESPRAGDADSAVNRIFKLSLEAQSQLALMGKVRAAHGADFQALAIAADDTAAGSLSARRASRLKADAATAAGDADWAAKHLTAMRKYSSRACAALEAEARKLRDENERLKRFTWAGRRSPEAAAQFIEEVRQNGISGEHRQLLVAAGYKEEEFD